jgi:release factor glutamine methyltransferase
VADSSSRLSVLSSRQTVAGLVDEIARRLTDSVVPTVARNLQVSGVIQDPLREARDLLAAVLDVPRHWPLLKENKWVESETWMRACAAADKRAAGAPLAYAAGRANIRHLTLDVDERVLIPRPETELLVDLVLEHARRGGVVIDVGTGSGAIAVALATEGKFDRVMATDVSLDALEVARGNALRHSAAVEFMHGDLLGPAATATGRVAAVVSNPPYISFGEITALPSSVRDWEPMMALLSARDGMQTTVRLVRQAAAVLEPEGLLALEVDARRASLVAEVIASDARYEKVSVQLDLAGRERFVLATRRRLQQ